MRLIGQNPKAYINARKLEQEKDKDRDTSYKKLDSLSIEIWKPTTTSTPIEESFFNPNSSTDPSITFTAWPEASHILTLTCDIE